MLRASRNDPQVTKTTILSVMCAVTLGFRSAVNTRCGPLARHDTITPRDEPSDPFRNLGMARDYRRRFYFPRRTPRGGGDCRTRPRAEEVSYDRRWLRYAVFLSRICTGGGRSASRPRLHNPDVPRTDAHTRDRACHPAREARRRRDHPRQP